MLHSEGSWVQRLRMIAIWFLAWSAIGVLFALPDLRNGNSSLEPLLSSLAKWWSWGLVAAGMTVLDRRLPFTDKQLSRRLIAHIPLSLVLTAFYLYVETAMRALVGIGSVSAITDPQIIAISLHGMFLWVWSIYWMILGGWLSKQYYERYISSEVQRERMERLSTEAQLRSLRLQLDPHFLFNALNTISSEVDANPACAKSMIEHLGCLLRLTLDSNDRQLVPLSEELAFLDHYLAIQRIRFGDRLRFEKEIGEDVRHVAVPSMTIQPLVENSIRHGLSQRASGGTVRLTAKRDGQQIKILVEDDGCGLPAGWSKAKTQGRGISITEQRLAGLYPDRQHTLDVRRRVGGGTEVELSFPATDLLAPGWRKAPRHA